MTITSSQTGGFTAAIFLLLRSSRFVQCPAGFVGIRRRSLIGLIRIVNGRLPWAWIDEEKAVPWVEKRSGLQLAESQRAAIRLALTAKALVITGGPGVGKDDDRQFNP